MIGGIDLTHEMYLPKERAKRTEKPRATRPIPKPERFSTWSERRLTYLRANGKTEDLIKEFGHE